MEEIKLKPSYATTGHVKNTLDLLSRMTPKKIDTTFVVDNNLATPSNAFRIVELLRWLGIIDVKGNVIEEVASKLRLVGEERNKFMAGLIKESYKDIFEIHDIKTAIKHDIINFFVSKYKFGPAQATIATRLFLYLCQTYNIEISEDLKKKTAVGIPKKRKKQQNISSKYKTKKGDKNNPQNMGVPFQSREDFIELKDDVMYIKIQNNSQAIKKAKSLLSIYEKDAETDEDSQRNSEVDLSNTEEK